MVMEYYRLVGHEAVPCTLIEWNENFKHDSRIVKKTTATVERNGKHDYDVEISTVFLGLDHNYSGVGPPLLFETRVFGGKLQGAMERCSTWDEALKQHYKWCNEVRDEEEKS